jgi:hypothetical protein
MLAINRDIMIRTAALIAAFVFFTAQGARAGDVALAANAVLHNFILVGSFFLDGLATAASSSAAARSAPATAPPSRRRRGACSAGASCSARPRRSCSFSSAVR